MTDPQKLLHQFVENGSETAFRGLVARYIDLIYATALRRVNGHTQLAQDVTQTVFIDLARKANTLPLDVMLGGWLHRHTGFVASTMMRTEQRRQERERQSVEMNALSNDLGWNEIAPILDETIDKLEPKDRDAIFLRFFERRQLKEVGHALGTSEDAAQKRVNRALEKIRALLAQRGFTLSLTALGTTLLAQPAVAAPHGLIAAACTKSLAVKTGSGWAGFSKGTPFSRYKIGLAVAVFIAGILLWPRPSPTPEKIRINPVGRSQFENKRRAVPTETISKVAENSNTSKVLRLAFVADDSGNPVQNVEVEFRAYDSNLWKRKIFPANQEGICDVPLGDGSVAILDLLSRSTGFAHTRLLWRPDRGEKLPTNYTIRLIPPVSLSGRVIDSDGLPVVGAKVGFNHHQNPAEKWVPESHEFGWIEVETDEDGRWNINAIAEDMIPRLYGNARHSNYLASEMIHFRQNPEVEIQLREGVHVFNLEKAITLSGIVVDARGQPVSEAKILVGKLGEMGARKTRSERDGSFIISGCKPGKELITVEADSFASKTIELEISPDPDPARIVLLPGKILRLRVMAKSGSPIAGAQVNLSTFGDGLIKGREKPLITQIEFLRRTDTDGRMVWTNAPDSDLLFHIAAPGFTVVRNRRIAANGEEHLVILAPALTIAGTVRSAEGGTLISKFRIVCGWPGANGPDWSPFEQDWLKFEGGKFRHTFVEPMTTGTTNLGHILRFEAAGFAPFVSRRILEDEGEVNLDVVLTPLVSIPITVLRPDGIPAARSDVGMVTSNSVLQLSPEGFSQVDRKTFKPSGYFLKTDTAGKITLSFDEGVTRVLFAHLDGFADITMETLTAHPIIQLQPWGRVEGVWTTNGQPAVGQILILQPPNRSYYVVTPKGSYSIETEEHGRFIFTNVPPGLNKLMYRKERRLLPLKDVEVRPGETNSISIGN